MNIKKQSQVILLKSTNNSNSIKAVLNFQYQDEKILFLTNSNTSFFKESLKKLQNNMPNFDEVYAHVSCMFLKNKLSVLDKRHSKSSFIAEIENLIQDKQFSTIYFHRLDALIDCNLQLECEFLISKIIESAQRLNKKVIFSINHKTELGQLLNSILSKVSTQEYTIGEDKKLYDNKLILLNSTDDTKLIKSTLNLYQEDGEILFLANKVTLDLKESFKKLQQQMPDFEKIYSKLSSMFLKDNWNRLDKIYGKVFFMYEIQEMMKDEKISTIYFHRLDTMFDGASSEDCEQMIDDIRDFAQYYHKKILFSINSKTELGKTLEPILQNKVDYEHVVEKTNYKHLKKLTYKPVNLVLPMKNGNRKITL